MLCINDQGGERMDVTEDVVATLRAGMGSHQPLVAQPGDGAVRPPAISSFHVNQRDEVIDRAGDGRAYPLPDPCMALLGGQHQRLVVASHPTRIPGAGKRTLPGP